MSQDRVRSVASLMRNPALAHIGATLALHQRVLKVVKSTLPEFLARHCLDCVVKPNRLVLYTDTPLFSSQLRFYTPQLQQDLEATYQLSFAEIQARNLLNSAHPTLPPRRWTLPSAEVVRLLRDHAALEPDSELGVALNRLANSLAEKNSRATPFASK
ncbi:MAG: DciA family protein [Methylococcaceae bacterium]